MQLCTCTHANTLTHTNIYTSYLRRLSRSGFSCQQYHLVGFDCFQDLCSRFEDRQTFSGCQNLRKKGTASSNIQTIISGTAVWVVSPSNNHQRIAGARLDRTVFDSPLYFFHLFAGSLPLIQMVTNPVVSPMQMPLWQRYCHPSLPQSSSQVFCRWKKQQRPIC